MTIKCISVSRSTEDFVNEMIFLVSRSGDELSIRTESEEDHL